MDYLCAKFGDFSFSRFGFIVRRETCVCPHDKPKITESQTHRQTEVDQRYRPTVQYSAYVRNYTVGDSV